MSEQPKTITPQILAMEALQMMRPRNITQPMVVEDHDSLGRIHLHALLDEEMI